jgi:8-oxo-dGTP pyrophosphatase MutT (NUDIX family)
MATPARLLLDELEQYQPTDDLEERHHRALMGHLVHASSPMSRDTFKPGHVTASLYIVDPEKKRVLLHHHRRLDRWLQMGGHVEANESPAVAALREGREESGLADLQLIGEGVLDVDVHGIPASGEGPAHLHYDVRFAAVTRKPGAIAMDAAESRDLQWMDFDKAIEVMDDPASTRAIGKIRKLLAQR